MADERLLGDRRYVTKEDEGWMTVSVSCDQGREGHVKPSTSKTTFWVASVISALGVDKPPSCPGLDPLGIPRSKTVCRMLSGNDPVPDVWVIF
jgi:hypothetical protein